MLLGWAEYITESSHNNNPYCPISISPNNLYSVYLCVFSLGGWLARYLSIDLCFVVVASQQYKAMCSTP